MGDEDTDTHVCTCQRSIIYVYNSQLHGHVQEMAVGCETASAHSKICTALFTLCETCIYKLWQLPILHIPTWCLVIWSQLKHIFDTDSHHISSEPSLRITSPTFNHLTIILQAYRHLNSFSRRGKSPDSTNNLKTESPSRICASLNNVSNCALTFRPFAC